jgi:AcrR family transcriptional regulator
VNAPAIKKARRARSDEAKQIRRAVILKAARRLFQSQDYDALTVESVARASRLAKGTVYLYFRSKEAIFLELLLDEVEAWFAALAEPLAGLSRDDDQAAATLLAASIAGRPTLRRLLALLHQTLERNVDDAIVRSFKLRGARAMADTAIRLERLLPRLGTGGGTRLLQYVHALVVGVGQMSEESEVVERVLSHPELQVFRVDFETTLRDLLLLVLRGWR